MFRVNAQLATEAIITSGDGTPGGTNVVIFIDATSGELKAVMPDGTVRFAEKQDSNKIKFVAAP